MEMLSFIMEWAIGPVLLVLYGMFNRQQAHATDIAVLKSQVETNRALHDREMKEFRATVTAIFAKLDKIEEFLRDRK